MSSGVSDEEWRVDCAFLRERCMAKYYLVLVLVIMWICYDLVNIWV